ncbi:MAG: hypothetical protein ACNI27_07430 [Desulfovibrio sp.]
MITTRHSKNITTGAKGQSDFNFHFVAKSSEHVKVEVGGTVLTGGYTVELADDGGLVTLTTPLAESCKVVIYREVPLTQESDYISNEAMPAEVLEGDLDKLAMGLQQLDEKIGRALIYPRSYNSNEIDDSVVHLEKLNQLNTEAQQRLAEAQWYVTTAKNEVVSVTNSLTSLAGYATDLSTIRDGFYSEDLANKYTGTEYRRKCTFIGSLPFASAYNSTRPIGATRVWILSDGNDISHWPTWHGSDRERLLINRRIIAVVNGKAFEIAVLATDTADNKVYIDLNPKHGQAVPDPSGNVQIFVFEESTSAEDKEVGTSMPVEYFAGGQFNVDLWSDSTSGSPTVAGWALTAGVITKNGKAFTSTGTGQAILYFPKSLLSVGEVLEFDIAAASGAGQYRVANQTMRNISVGKVSVTIQQADIDFDVDATMMRLVFYLDNAEAVTLNKVAKLVTNQALNVPFSVGDYGQLNAGYWKGKEWVSQLLPDLIVSNNVISFHMQRPISWLEIEVLRADGTWITYESTGWETVISQPFYFAYNVKFSVVYINLTNSYAGLGYSSEADFKARSAVRIKSSSPARRTEPIANPQDIVVFPEDVVFLQSYSLVDGGALASELLGSFPTGDSVYSNVARVKGFTVRKERVYDKIHYEATAITPRQQTESCLAVAFGLIKKDGTYHRALWTKELIFDGNWGDSGHIPVTDKCVTDLDDNGNVVSVGCWAIDTGIPVA